MLAVGAGNALYWEVCGNPAGKAAVVLHGGPGSGCTAWHRRLFDPGAYRIVLFDQRNCGRSTPHASEPTTDLSENTTWHLVADIEALRAHLGIARWLVLGGSWGCTLALAYAEANPGRVSEMVLFGVTTGRKREYDWTFRGGLSAFFPEEWERLRTGIAEEYRSGDVVESYRQMLCSEDGEIRERAAYEWCLWESASPAWPPRPGLAPRFEDAGYRMAFARIVTHYVHDDGWVADDELLRNAGKLARIPGVMINGRFDFQAPIANAWELRSAWPGAELVIVDDAGHAADAEAMTREIVRATDGYRGSESD